MARWKLATAHYLNVEDNKWEYQEVSRTTGKTIRIQVPVPTLLDPTDPADFTHKWGHPQQPGVVSDIEGEIIVSRGPSVDSRDVMFVGDPTPDMIPLDDEAKVISASFAERWRYKPDTDNAVNYSQILIDQFQTTMSEVVAKPTKIEGLDALIVAMTEVVKSNQEMTKHFVRRV
jgi:hypothetical protein